MSRPGTWRCAGECPWCHVAVVQDVGSMMIHDDDMGHLQLYSQGLEVFLGGSGRQGTSLRNSMTRLPKQLQRTSVLHGTCVDESHMATSQNP